MDSRHPRYFHDSDHDLLTGALTLLVNLMELGLNLYKTSFTSTKKLDQVIGNAVNLSKRTLNLASCKVSSATSIC